MNLLHTTGLLFSFAVVACSSTTTSTKDDAQNPQNPPSSTTPTQTTRTALSFDGPCSTSACGEVPSSNTSSTPLCSPAADTANSCTWTDPDPNGTVSYRQCADSECPTTAPDASVCPVGLEFKGSTCGSENDGACIWRAACVAPLSTTPCPNPSGCGDAKPELGVICKDGSTGDLLCRQTGATCSWQRSCE